MSRHAIARCRRPLPASGRSGSWTPNTSMTTQITAGITATQNAAWKSPAKYAIAPTPAAARRRRPGYRAPGAARTSAPRTSVGVMSAISASRGAPRMPLPMRSAKRAATIHPSVGARGKTSLVTAREPIAQHDERLAPPETVREHAREHLDDHRRRLGNALDDADRRTCSRQARPPCTAEAANGSAPTRGPCTC